VTFQTIEFKSSVCASRRKLDVFLLSLSLTLGENGQGHRGPCVFFFFFGPANEVERLEKE